MRTLSTNTFKVAAVLCACCWCDLGAVHARGNGQIWTVVGSDSFCLLQPTTCAERIRACTTLGHYVMLDMSVWEDSMMVDVHDVRDRVVDGSEDMDDSTQFCVSCIGGYSEESAGTGFAFCQECPVHTYRVLGTYNLCEKCPTQAFSSAGSSNATACKYATNAVVHTTVTSGSIECTANDARGSRC
jgi:hypothetical protein